MSMYRVGTQYKMDRETVRSLHIQKIIIQTYAFKVFLSMYCHKFQAQSHLIIADHIHIKSQSKFKISCQNVYGKEQDKRATVIKWKT